LLQGFIVFGFVPVFCKYIKLVQTTQDLGKIEDMGSPLLDKLSKSFHKDDDEEFFGIDK